MAVSMLFEPEQLQSAFLQLKEKRKNSKPLLPQLAWLFSQCSPSEDNLFSPLCMDPSKIAQGYVQWKAMHGLQKMCHPLRMRRDTIIIQPLSHNTCSDYFSANIHPHIMALLQRFIQAFYHGTRVILMESLDVSLAKKMTTRVHKDTGREQILVEDIIKFLKGRKYPKARCIIGVTIVDLYPGEQWNFTLGHASYNDGVAVASFGRYFNMQATGEVPALQQQLQNIWILVRVLSHELGHLFGLDHCVYFNCGMNESNSIIQAALQPLIFCPICLRKLHKVLKFDLKQRYLDIDNQCHVLTEELSSSLSSSRSTPSLSQVREDGVDEQHLMAEEQCSGSPPQLHQETTIGNGCAQEQTDKALSKTTINGTENGYQQTDKVLSQTTATSDENGCQETDMDLVQLRRPSAMADNAEVLQSPLTHFKRASQWLKKSVLSLDQFLESNDTSSK